MRSQKGELQLQPQPGWSRKTSGASLEITPSAAADDSRPTLCSSVSPVLKISYRIYLDKS